MDRDGALMGHIADVLQGTGDSEYLASHVSFLLRSNPGAIHRDSWTKEGIPKWMKRLETVSRKHNVEERIATYEIMRESVLHAEHGLCLKLCPKWGQIIVEGIKVHDSRTYYTCSFIASACNSNKLALAVGVYSDLWLSLHTSISQQYCR
jgi:hypothetical protein